MHAFFEIIVFTAASQEYADFILNWIDPEKDFIIHRLYRQHTKYEDGVYIKDLSILNRDLKKTIIVDNIGDNFKRQKQNGIEIKSWYGDPADTELKILADYLETFAILRVKDVREILSLFKQD